MQILQNIDVNDITYIIYIELLPFQDYILLHVESLNSSNSTPRCLTKQSTHWKMDQKLFLLLNYICPDVSWMHGVPVHDLSYAPEKISTTLNSTKFCLNIDTIYIQNQFRTKLSKYVRTSKKMQSKLQNKNFTSTKLCF